MLVFSGLALAANVTCLRLLWRFRREDVNMTSTFDCSRNDVISNVRVLSAAEILALPAAFGIRPVESDGPVILQETFHYRAADEAASAGDEHNGVSRSRAASLSPGPL